MSAFGKFDFTQLKNFQSKLRALDKPDKFVDDCANEIAGMLLRYVKKRTPVGQYPDGSGKVGGNLRRNWSIGELKQSGDTIYVEVYNNTEYAPYVEYGHRQTPGRYVPAIGKKLKANWVEGKFMLKISADEVRTLAPEVIRDMIELYLEELI